MSKILLFANSDWYLYNFRLSLAKNLREQGHEVILVSPPGDFQELLQRDGFPWIPFELSRQSINPFGELVAIWRLILLYHRIRPDIVHHFTIKPVIYGSIAAHLTGITGIINSITGLGHLFINTDRATRLLRAIASRLYRMNLYDTQVIFENPEDRDIFIQKHLIYAEQAHLILGTGVDVEKYRPTDKSNDKPVVLFSSRMLVTKGLLEYVEAARALRQKGLNARFALAEVDAIRDLGVVGLARGYSRCPRPRRHFLPAVLSRGSAERVTGGSRLRTLDCHNRCARLPGCGHEWREWLVGPGQERGGVGERSGNLDHQS